MSGYRQHSYDPNAYERPGPVKRPFNWVQWLGVGFVVVGLGAVAAHALARLGLIPQLFDDILPLIVLLSSGSVMISSRRHPADDPAPEFAAERKRWLIITGLICAVILGAAAFIELGGAAQ